MSHDRSNFRPDINGLRAIAVAVVVLYHFGARGFAGGFCGVDVFFAISGYLMTRIVVGGIEGGRLSVLGFYAARARRIVPALLVLCAAVLGFGAKWLTPPDFDQLGRHAASSAAFVSNIVYWRGFGYFNADAHEKWLLHTWSLSVEWQFYLLYPLMLLAARRWLKSSSWATATVAVLTGLSFVLCLLLTHFRPVAAFYLIPTRAWEMLAGGLVFLAGDRLAERPWSRSVAWAGIALVALSVAAFYPELAWPGVAAAAPVLGTCAVIAARPRRFALLDNPVSQFLGNASYSIYLWHWPVVVYLHLRCFDTATAAGMGILASIALGWLSFRVVEVPARRWLERSRGSVRALLVSGAAAAGVVAAGSAVAVQKGAPERASMGAYAQLEKTQKFATVDNGWCHVSRLDPHGQEIVGLQWDDQYGQCFIGDRAAHSTALLWGDSHAAHFSPVVDRLAKRDHVRVQEMSTPGCPPLIGGEQGANPLICQRFRTMAMDVASKVSTVVLAARWDVSARHPEFADQLRSTLLALRARGPRVVVFLQGPLFAENIAKRHAYSPIFNDREPESYPADPAAAKANATIRAVAAAVPGVEVVDPAGWMCSNGSCVTHIGKTFAFYDDNHMTIDGGKALGDRLVAQGWRLFR